MTRLWSNTRCVDGRTFRHDPMPDDPDLETDIGQCEECNGAGCDRPRCVGCDETKGLRMSCDGGGFVPATYVCRECFTGADDGPCFDDLPEVK
jgi:hypothetical protein